MGECVVRLYRALSSTLCQTKHTAHILQVMRFRGRRGEGRRGEGGMLNENEQILSRCPSLKRIIVFVSNLLSP